MEWLRNAMQSRGLTELMFSSDYSSDVDKGGIQGMWKVSEWMGGVVHKHMHLRVCVCVCV